MPASDAPKRRLMLAADLWEGELRGCVVDGQPILVVRLADGVHAYDDRCLHQSVPLSEGRLSGTHLRCRAHEWEYDLCTGKGINPKGVCLKRYEVTERDDYIWIAYETPISGGAIEDP